MGIVQRALDNLNYRLGKDPESKGAIKQGVELPTYTSDDEGKILKIVDGVAVWVVPEVELPTHTGGDEGKILKIVDGAVAWDTPEDELPAHTSADEGKILKIVDGAVAWDAIDDPESEASGDEVG